MSGDSGEGGNVFERQVKVIRDAMAFHGCVEIGGVGLDEIAPALDRHRPAVLHVSAHHDGSGVHLVARAAVDRVSLEGLAQAMGCARYRPRCVVLDVCGSGRIAASLAGPDCTVLAWRSLVLDDHGIRFAEVFYRRLAARDPLPTAIAEADARLVELSERPVPPLRQGARIDPVI